MVDGVAAMLACRVGVNVAARHLRKTADIFAGAPADLRNQIDSLRATGGGEGDYDLGLDGRPNSERR